PPAALAEPQSPATAVGADLEGLGGWFGQSEGAEELALLVPRDVRPPAGPGDALPVRFGRWDCRWHVLPPTRVTRGQRCRAPRPAASISAVASIFTSRSFTRGWVGRFTRCRAAC